MVGIAFYPANEVRLEKEIGIITRTDHVNQSSLNIPCYVQRVALVLPLINKRTDKQIVNNDSKL